MNPTQSDVHVNVPLTNISVAFIQSQDAFIAGRAFPVIPVQKQSDRYWVYDIGDLNRDEMKERAPASESSGSGYKTDNTPTYYAPIKAFHKDIDDPTRSNEDSPLSSDRDATIYLTQKFLIHRENQFAVNHMKTGVWGKDITGVAGAPGANQVIQWNDAASTPLENIRAGMTAVQLNTGFRPNRIVLGQAVWDILVDHPDIVDRVKYGQTGPGPARVTRQAVAALLELDEILVMSSIVNTADEGAAATHSFIGGKKALLLYTPPQAGILVPSAGYTFAWTGYMGASQDGSRISRFRMEHLKADRIEIEAAFDLKRVASSLGYFFDSIIT